MTNELKPCPFCNGVAELEERKLHAWEHGGAFAVRCSQCRMGDEGFYFSEAAVNKWNTRAIEQDSQPQDLRKYAFSVLPEQREIRTPKDPYCVNQSYEHGYDIGFNAALFQVALNIYNQQ